MAVQQVSGNIVSIMERRIFYGHVHIADGRITSIEEEGAMVPGRPFILPGFIDSHVHIESSMLVPSEFAKLAVVHGTVASISDPHEIANVCGMSGVQYMIDNGKTVPFKFHFGAPSCVPATTFETAGASLDAAEVTELLAMPEIKYLSEMMNFPGVLNKDAEVFKKIAAAKHAGKPIDGHAPGLRGEAAKQYTDAGISTDHECFTEEEAAEKLSYGMKILIREGSAARNFDALIDLVHDHYDNMMFCSDDKHPDSLVAGHINDLCARAADRGIDIFKVLQVACINPVLHYKMDSGILAVSDPADFIVTEDLLQFRIIQTYIDGQLVAENGKSHISTVASKPINRFNCDKKEVGDFAVPSNALIKEIPVIEAFEGQLITNKLMVAPTVADGQIISNITDDILKIVVVNRYNNAPVAKGFIKNIGLKEGAMASTVAHDSHNIVAVGTDDESLCDAVNLLIEQQGGISAVSESTMMVLPLPVGGLMSNEDGYKVAADYTAIDLFVKTKLKSTLAGPFMTLSFMALLVIPHLKLSDKGLFDGDEFRLI